MNIGRRVRADACAPKGVSTPDVRPDGASFPVGLYNFEIARCSRTSGLGATPVDLYTRNQEVRSDSEGVMLGLEGGAAIHVSGVAALRAAGPTN